jgi:two-component system, OmpR family, sensor kinase
MPKGLRYGLEPLIPLSALIVGGSVSLFVLATAVFAMSSYVSQLQRDADLLLHEALRSSAGEPGILDARKLGEGFASHAIRKALIVVFVDGKHRVVLSREDGAGGIDVRSAADRSGEPQANGARSRMILGLATVCGLQKLRGRLENVEIDVGVNEPVFVHAIEAYEPALGIALAFLVIITAVSSRLLTNQALRPLLEVTAALERFAVADFRRQVAATGRRGELTRLALAYNGAVEQVQQAFGEREKAQESIRRFTSDAGHQLRTPLTVIRGYIGALSRDAPDETNRILNAMNQQCLLIGSLVERLILLEQWEEDTHEDPAPIDLGVLIREIVDPLVLSQPKRSIRILDDDRVFAAVDIDEFRYAVTNILENALKYTLGSVLITLRTTGERSLVEIADEGPGMKAEDAQRAFDRFFRGGRRDVEGSGLGLAIAKRAIEHAKGRISLETTVDRGSRFAISLPACKPYSSKKDRNVS